MVATDADVPVIAQTEGAPNTSDVDTETVIINGKTVHRQRIRLAGEKTTDLVQVRSFPPLYDDAGLVVRDPETDDIRRIEERILLGAMFPLDKEFITEKDLITLRGM